MIGEIFGKWTVTGQASKKEYVLCRCSCGTEREVYRGSLKSKRSTCCGCDRIKRIIRVGYQNRKHGLSKSRFYIIYKAMKERCNNPNTNGYKNYGGKGITLCERWNVFQNFIDDMYESYTKHCEVEGEKNTTLDRVDSNGNYDPNNCKWSTVIEQHNNTRNNRFVEVNGVVDTLANWCRKYDMNYGRVQGRLNNGWEPIIALTRR